jgi:hypothetical protein
VLDACQLEKAIASLKESREQEAMDLLQEAGNRSARPATVVTLKFGDATKQVLTADLLMCTEAGRSALAVDSDESNSIINIPWYSSKQLTVHTRSETHEPCSASSAEELAIAAEALTTVANLMKQRCHDCSGAALPQVILAFCYLNADKLLQGMHLDAFSHTL